MRIKKLLFGMIICNLSLVSFKVFSAEELLKVDVVAIEYPPFITAGEVAGGIAFNRLNKRTIPNSVEWVPVILPPARAALVTTTDKWCASFYPVSDAQKPRKVELSKRSVRIGLVRTRQNQLFAWKTLKEFTNLKVALLRTTENSNFIKQFKDSGMITVQVETVQAAVEMVQIGRVDFGVIDDTTFDNLTEKEKRALQFSENTLLATPITIYLNDNCHPDWPSIFTHE